MWFTIANRLRLTLFRISNHKAEMKFLVFLGLFLGLIFFLEISVLVALGITVGIFLATGGYKITWVVIKTFPRDMR